MYNKFIIFLFRIMVKKFIFGVLIFLLWISLFFIFWLKDKQQWNDVAEKQTIIYWYDWTHLWLKINDILNKDNYDKIWINPEKYDSMESFLVDFKTFSWVTIDPINEKFSIAIKKENGDTLYIPYNFKINKEVFDNNVNKNLAILDIYSSYKNDLIYGWYDSNSKSKVIFEWDMVHPLTNRLNDIFSSKTNVFKVISDIEKSKVKWQENTELLAYLYDLIWDYATANITRRKACIEFQNCEKYINLNISWKITDTKWNPISWVKVELLNNSENYTITKDDWSYNFSYKAFPFTHLRFKASTLGYSDWFSNYSLNDYFFPIDKKTVVIDFLLDKPENVISINSENIDTYKKWAYYILDTTFSKYFIPLDWLYYEDDKKFIKWDFDVYLYHFTKSSNMSNLLENDTFEPVYWYVWNIMKTFWMPYIQIVEKNTKKELFTKSSNPIILQNQVYHMKELYSNSDKIYTAITDEDMEYLVKVSNESENPYPIDFDFLTANNFLRWPARWTLDRKTWVWSNVGHRVINVGGLVELPFFHIKDN